MAENLDHWALGITTRFPELQAAASSSPQATPIKILPKEAISLNSLLACLRLKSCPVGEQKELVFLSSSPRLDVDQRNSPLKAIWGTRAEAPGRAETSLMSQFKHLSLAGCSGDSFYTQAKEKARLAADAEKEKRKLC